MGIATFDYAAWLVRYPEFANVTNPQATELFIDAGLFLDNTDGSIVQDVPIRTRYLWMITAHLAQLNYGSSLVPKNSIVGRIDSAQEGTVNFTTKYPDLTGQAAWFSQTQYGASYWNATARYRLFSYRAGPRRRMRPW